MAEPPKGSIYTSTYLVIGKANQTVEEYKGLMGELSPALGGPELEVNSAKMTKCKRERVVEPGPIHDY